MLIYRMMLSLPLSKHLTISCYRRVSQLGHKASTQDIDITIERTTQYKGIDGGSLTLKIRRRQQQVTEQYSLLS
jgi:hypothetical protein